MTLVCSIPLYKQILRVTLQGLAFIICCCMCSFDTSFIVYTKIDKTNHTNTHTALYFGNRINFGHASGNVLWEKQPKEQTLVDDNNDRNAMSKRKFDKTLCANGSHSNLKYSSLVLGLFLQDNNLKFSFYLVKIHYMVWYALISFENIPKPALQMVYKNTLDCIKNS